MKSIYLDNAATTQLDQRVLDEMLPYFKENYGNASSIHNLGRKAAVAVEESREKIAHYIGAEPSEVIFTSGGTESNNSIIKGVIAASDKKHIITSRVEHHAVLHPIQYGRKNGIKATYLDCRPTGSVTPKQVEEAITDETALVSLIHVNNEIGAINPIKEISKVCRDKGVLLHSDTVQSIGKIPVNVKDLGIDFLNLSGHKIYGPKGVGALYVKGGSPWKPWMEGGSQERKRRGGTLNVPGIVGLGKALELAIGEMEQNQSHIKKLQQHMVAGLQERFPDLIAFNGEPETGIYNIVNFSFPLDQDKALDGEMLLLNLDVEGICCSNGSACTSGAVEASHVLMALGMVTPTAKSSLRFSLSKNNTREDVDYTLEKLDEIVHRMLKTA
ncbi:MAG: cysteine desulfurase family protein [Balneolales bacterium]